MADGNGRYHGLVTSSSEEIAQTNTLPTSKTSPITRQPSGSIEILQVSRSPSKFSSTRSRLMLRDWWWLPRSLKLCVADVKTSPGNPNYHQGVWNCHLQERVKPLEIHLFVAGCRHVAVSAQCFFPTSTRNGFCSHLWKIIFRQPWPPPKQPRYTY